MPTFTLLNTRPEHQAKGLSDLVEAAGGESVNCPTLSIVYRDLPSNHAPLKAFDKVVFISVNAVNGFIKQGLMPSKTEQACLTWYVIGRATMKAAEKVGLPIREMVGEQFDSESLLKHPDLQDLSQQKILIVKGENGRELLADTFEQRGATVETWSLYSRQPLPLCSQAWLRFQQVSTPWVLASSAASLESLIKAIQVAEQRLNGTKFPFENQQACLESQRLISQKGFAWLLKQPLVVFSQRIKHWARRQGWQGNIFVVTIQSDQGVIDCIIESQRDNKGKQHD